MTKPKTRFIAFLELVSLTLEHLDPLLSFALNLSVFYFSYSYFHNYNLSLLILCFYLVLERRK